MDGPQRITRVVIENYRSIRYCDVSLGPLTFLVGPNGSGKSNFLDALRFLVQSMHDTFDRVLERRGGVDSLFYRSSLENIAPSFSIMVEIDVSENQHGLYELRLGRRSHSGYQIELERCVITHSDGTYETAFLTENGTLKPGYPASPAPAIPSDRSALPVFSGSGGFASIYSFISGMTFYAPNPESMRGAKPAGSGTVLARDGANVADVLSRMEREKIVSDRLTEYLQAINGTVGSIHVVDLEAKHRLLTVGSLLDKVAFSSRELSDGTLRSLAILTALFQGFSGSRRISVVGLEEPENAVHPAAAGVLFDAMSQASEIQQVIAATHSADLLDRKDVQDSAILAVEMKDSETRIGRLSEGIRSAMYDRLYTAGELLRMNQLRPEVVQENSRT